ncbi:alanine racemase [candidate division KSB1 bacterium]
MTAYSVKGTGDMTVELKKAIKITSDSIKSLHVTRPTLLLDTKKTENNIDRMIRKAHKRAVRLRPHFKTHQSTEIGGWFRKSGINAITVSSVDMAVYFADDGWDDITIAFPVNILEIERLSVLASSVSLGLVVESVETVRFLESSLSGNADLWIKTDTGYHRTGVLWNNSKEIVNIVESAGKSHNLSFRGLLSHAGNSYKARSKDEIRMIFNDNIDKLNQTRDMLRSHGVTNIEISVGDTPGCSVTDTLEGMDEIRPGNFVFFDVSQYHLESCDAYDISVAMACPVVAKHPDRNTIIVHGGAVHFSKDSLILDGETFYGYGTIIRDNAWGDILKDVRLVSISQEHGVIRAPDDVLNNIEIGDLLLVLPVHSCLTVDLMRKYLTLDGDWILTERA